MKCCPKCHSQHGKTGKFCSRSCANSRGPMSENDKKLRSEWSKAKLGGAAIDRNLAKKGGLARAAQRQQSCPIIHYICPTCSSPFESRQKRVFCSKQCGRDAGAIGGFQPNSTIVHRSIYKNQQMDSGAELAFAQLLDQHNIQWIKNSSTYFNFVDSSGKKRKYYPDFYLPDYDFWIEIKGKKYIRKDDDLRLAAVGSNIERIFSHNLKLPSCIGDSTGTRTLLTRETI